MLTFFLWLLLLIVSWPVALLALLLYPVVWLLLLPFRLIGITVSAVFDLIAGIIRFPLKILKGPSAVR
ncbi:MAG: hypothetical protein GXO87_05705 [Chlorobi bacterium]|nr:hypothetical protein [Chlorobiota bacterium]